MSLDAKFKILMPYLQGKRVLDVGCVGDVKTSGSINWTHHRIAQMARYVLGIDILEDEVKKLQAKGYNVQAEDAQNIGLLDEERFDIIFASHLIEHLTDFNGFFESVRRNIKAEGNLIIITPNVHSIYRLLQLALGIPPAISEHTCWFDRTTLINLVRKYDFTVMEIGFVKVVTLSDVWDEIRKFRSFRGIVGRSWSFLVETLIPGQLGKRDLVMVAKPSKKGLKKINNVR